RSLEDPRAQALVRALSPKAMGMMGFSSKRAETPGVFEWASLIVTSIFTAGVLPAVFWGMSHSRRRLIRRFVQEGQLAVARVGRILGEETGFGEKVARVHYSFEADGAVHRDADLVAPRIAHRWQEGDEIQVLYIPLMGYESIIVSL
ncbi:MAG TPA: hypothetical protein VEA99_06970, partial [Gemmatimonadaceae bacterium]|nr:hypothetical protein [Gemmatimonadaceae bacterium]